MSNEFVDKNMDYYIFYELSTMNYELGGNKLARTEDYRLTTSDWVVLEGQ
jgi:hypothetical protein